KNDILKQEAKLIYEKLHHKDTLICLDEKGVEYSSVAFSSLIEKEQTQSTKLIFLIGGSFGIADEIKAISKHTISFSKMTFPHQLIRLFFVEQLYRAFSILKNEKYHHE
nr:23S rRNA (pseudouridine(1915)-N(3))-methyltransferase RlmH [Chitinophagaceae bacterium]